MVCIFIARRFQPFLASSTRVDLCLPTLRRRSEQMTFIGWISTDTGCTGCRLVETKRLDVKKTHSEHEAKWIRKEEREIITTTKKGEKGGTSKPIPKPKARQPTNRTRGSSRRGFRTQLETLPRGLSPPYYTRTYLYSYVCWWQRRPHRYHRDPTSINTRKREKKGYS